MVTLLSCGLVLQVAKEYSSTGFVVICAVDPSSRHPAAGFRHWDYITCEYDPCDPSARGKESRITHDQLTSFLLRNDVRTDFADDGSLSLRCEEEGAQEKTANT